MLAVSRRTVVLIVSIAFCQLLLIVLPRYGVPFTKSRATKQNAHQSQQPKSQQPNFTNKQQSNAPGIEALAGTNLKPKQSPRNRDIGWNPTQIGVYTMMSQQLNQTDRNREKGSAITKTNVDRNRANNDSAFVKTKVTAEIIHKQQTADTNSDHSKTFSVTDLYTRLVCLTALSDNHFIESKNMFESVQRCLPSTKIIVYDLGLIKYSDKVRDYRNVELRPFPFEDYKHLPHVKNLRSYAWKPIIVTLVSQEYDVIMYGDSSMRMLSCDINSALEHLLNFPFFNAHPRPPAHAIEFTHDGMMRYLHYPKNRKDMKDVIVLEANAWLMWADAQMKEKLLEPWLDCALHQECIAPSGAKILPCRITQNHDGHFIGCHRYDQSALNLILAREFGNDIAERASNKTLSDLLWTIERL